MSEYPSKKQRTDTAILHAAKVLLEQYGLEGVSFDAIARQAGVCRTTVFNHFSTTSQLFAALQTAELDEILAVGQHGGLFGRARLDAVFHQLIDDTAKYPHMMTSLTNNLILCGGGEAITRLEALLAQGLTEAGWRETRVISTQRMAVLLMGLYYGLINDCHIHARPFDAARLRREMQAMLDYVIDGKEDEQDE